MTPVHVQIGACEGGQQDMLAQPQAALSNAEFLRLCQEPPLQGPAAKLAPRSFVPLSDEEAPRPGMLLGLDAEFVALSQPEKRLVG